MKFTSQSLKPDLKPQNEDFIFQKETPRGHFFAVLDFDQHDFANLNTTLEAKLETIVGSFVTLSQFSADLFLGFLAREINEFLHSLGEHSGDEELSCSAALCLVGGNRISYFTCGDVRIVLLNQGRMLPLTGVEAADSDQSEQPIRRLGQYEEGSLSDRVQHCTLKEADLVLIMTSGIAGEFEGQTLVDHVSSLISLKPEIICDTLMDASESSQEDRTLVVLGGPYEQFTEPVIADSSRTRASSEQRLDTTKEIDTEGVASQRNKAVDEDRFLELDQKVENLGVVLASKADTAELLGLQGELLKLGALAKEKSTAREDGGEEAFPMVSQPEAAARQSSGGRPLMWVALLLVVGIAGGFIGGWINASRNEKSAEAWTVKTSGNQILISRLNNEASPSTVTLNTAQPLKTSGEQTFSSFADVKQYIDTISLPAPPAKVEQVEPEPQTVSESRSRPSPSAPTKEAKPAEVVSSIAFRQGDSLQKLAQRYNVAPAKLIALNPKITRWSLVKVGQRVVVPGGRVNSRTGLRPAEQSSTRQPTNTTTRKVTVERGDTLDKLANRHNLSPSRLKELNPQITDWSRIQAGQKVLVRTPVRG